MAPSVSYGQAEEALRARLSPDALAHSHRVAHAARELADVYGVDAEDAAVAGLLHDWDRDLSSGDLLVQAEALGVPVAEVDRAVPYLLHAKTGAASAALALPGLEARIVRAIARHTVGDAEMTDLDRVVYVADMLEPGRKHAPLDGIREDVGRLSLDELFYVAYRASVHYLIEEGKLIHPDTVVVWNSLARRRT